MSFRAFVRALGAALVGLLGFTAPAPAASAVADRAPVILISLDGFRWDYCDLHPAETPTLRRLRAEGVSTRSLVPAFPSNTFPNHYTLVTGLYPAHHGIVNNKMFDPRTGEFFRYNNPASSREAQWWGGEPIWITAVKQGRISACSHWAGSEAEIGGHRATYWRPFDYFDVTFEQRLEKFAGWFALPPAQRPAVAVFYIEEANARGHYQGPDSAALVATLRQIDTQVETLLARLARDGVTPNVVIVSDHGMTAVSPDRRLALDDYLDVSTVQIEDSGSTLGLRPRAGVELATIERALARLPHAQVYRAENLPARFQMSGHPRIPPLWILPEEGWRIDTSAAIQQADRNPRTVVGDHGYDPALANMHGIFLAHGPAVRRGVSLPECENIHVYNLLCALASLTPAPNDGDDRLVRAALR